MMLGAAMIFDLGYGEYPAPVHPVVWIGRLVDALAARGPEQGNARQFLFGLGLTLALVALFALPAWLALEYVRNEGGSFAYILVGALALKPTFSLRLLLQSVAAVRSRLVEGDLKGARLQVGQIVSRDTAALSPALVAAAAIESAAENFSDSLVAPLFYFALGGPAAALGYRVINTIDAMIGYRGRYEYLGKAPARLDDVLNFVPARLAGVLIALSAGVGGGSAAGAFRTMGRDHAATASPNAGWPMSAMAGALERRLEKPDHHVLGGAMPFPEPRDIGRALLVLGGAAVLAVLLVVVSLGLRYAR